MLKYSRTTRAVSLKNAGSVKRRALACYAGAVVALDQVLGGGPEPFAAPAAADAAAGVARFAGEDWSAEVEPDGRSAESLANAYTALLEAMKGGMAVKLYEELSSEEVTFGHGRQALLCLDKAVYMSKYDDERPERLCTLTTNLELRTMRQIAQQQRTDARRLADCFGLTLGLL